MEQNRLRQLEDHCIQEHAPTCTATCPARVDVRGLMAEAARGNFTAALKILRKTVPFPAIIGCICDQPCQKACVRKDAGDAIAIAALERACADLGELDKVPVLPRRSKQVAIIGGGLSSLTVAYDLAKKGYGVVIFEMKDRLGGSLWDIPGTLLPADMISKDLAVLDSMTLEVRLNARVAEIESGSDNLAVQIMGEPFDALYVGTGAANSQHFGLDVNDQGRIKIDPLTYVTSREGVFAGGGAVMCNPVQVGNSQVRLERSAILAVADGRRAATSIDRFLQRVSMTASRILEGAYSTRLFTSLEGIEPLPVVQMSTPDAGYSREEALCEAQRCIQCQCLECVKVCEYLKQYGSYPKRYIREIYNNLSIVSGERQKNQFINSCSLCGLCGEVCPEELDMGEVCLEARRMMVTQKRMPPSAHDFALRDMAFSNGEKFSLARSQPGTPSSRYAFFPGCQLSGSSPEYIENIYHHLTQKLTGGVGLVLRCCGAPAEWAARSDLFQQSQAEFREEYARMGKPELILACSSCYHIFQTYYPEIKISSMWTQLDQLGLPHTESHQNIEMTVAIHDPCTTRNEEAIQDSIRNILDRLGVRVQELPLSRQKTECCSYGGQMWLTNRKLAQDVIQRRIDESPLDYVTYCAMCRDFYASNGKRTLHLLDLVFHPTKAQELAQRQGPDYSDRHENRARLKKKLLKDLWKENMDALAYESISLIIPTDVRASMRERLILVEDIQQVIYQAEHSGRRMLNTETGHFLAYHRPACVTYWVEYSADGDTFTIYNAYSHRMVIEEGKGQQK